MSIYGRGSEFDLSKLGDVKKPIVIGAAVVVVIVALFFIFTAVAGFLQAPKIELWFGDNAGEMHAGDRVFLYAKVTNTEEDALTNVVVTAEPMDSTSFAVTPSPAGSNKQNIIGPGETRQFRFFVNPDLDVLPGEFAIKIRVESEDREYAQGLVKIRVVK